MGVNFESFNTAAWWTGTAYVILIVIILFTLHLPKRGRNLLSGKFRQIFVLQTPRAPLRLEDALLYNAFILYDKIWIFTVPIPSLASLPERYNPVSNQKVGRTRLKSRGSSRESVSGQSKQSCHPTNFRSRISLILPSTARSHNARDL